MPRNHLGYTPRTCLMNVTIRQFHLCFCDNSAIVTCVLQFRSFSPCKKINPNRVFLNPRRNFVFLSPVLVEGWWWTHIGTFKKFCFRTLWVRAFSLGWSFARDAPVCGSNIWVSSVPCHELLQRDDQPTRCNMQGRLIGTKFQATV